MPSLNNGSGCPAESFRRKATESPFRRTNRLHVMGFGPRVPGFINQSLPFCGFWIKILRMLDSLAAGHAAGRRNYSTTFWLAVVLIMSLGAYTVGVRTAREKFLDQGYSTSTSPMVKLRGTGSQPPSNLVKHVDFKQFWDLWELINAKFYKQPLDEEKLLYGAMSGLTQATGDPYTSFFEPAVAQEFTQSLEGKFEGIGAEIGMKNGQVKIIAPLPDTPAARAGLLAGDSILMIDAASTEGMSVDKAVSLIRGKKGTTVVLTVGRLKILKDKNTKEAVELKIPIVRDTIAVPSVVYKFLPDDKVLIGVSHFNNNTYQEFSKALDQILAKDIKGVILDLRNNPGGFLDHATAIAGEWLGDKLIVIERRQGKKVDEFHGTGQSRLRDVPTVVLVNEGSASAAEIVAGALQDYKTAAVVGTKTFGKGSIQDYTELEAGTGVKITVAEWLTPNERFINEIGIDPDVVIEITEEDYAAGRDPQLDQAVEILGGKTTAAKSN